jgi:hypothetical protein
MQKNVFFQKRPHFWAKNGDICIFGLKTRVKKRKYEPKIIQKPQKSAQISMILAQKGRKIRLYFPLLQG